VIAAAAAVTAAVIIEVNRKCEGSAYGATIASGCKLELKVLGFWWQIRAGAVREQDEEREKKQESVDQAEKSFRVLVPVLAAAHLWGHSDKQRSCHTDTNPYGLRHHAPVLVRVPVQSVEDRRYKDYHCQG